MSLRMGIRNILDVAAWVGMHVKASAPPKDPDFDVSGVIVYESR